MNYQQGNNSTKLHMSTLLKVLNSMMLKNDIGIFHI